MPGMTLGSKRGYSIGGPDQVELEWLSASCRA